jgi:hypothetical protein
MVVMIVSLFRAGGLVDGLGEHEPNAWRQQPQNLGVRRD